MPKVFIFLVIACVMVIAGVALADASLSQYIAVFISLLALVVSIVSAFKEDIFPFQPHVLLDEIIMALPTEPPHTNVTLVLPITFINKGNGAGVIHMLALLVETEGNKKLYSPTVQIDIQKYISQRRMIHAENIVGTFGAFALSGKASAQKHIMFLQETQSEAYPLSPWIPGTYTFTLFINRSNGGKAEEVSCVGPMTITQGMLTSYSQGSGQSLSPNRLISV
jgi:hypothetical protein